MSKVIDISIIDILKSVFDKLKTAISIIDIVDNLDNTYTLYLAKINLLEAGFVITIVNTPNFNDDYVIKSIDKTAKTITIDKQTGITISTFGKVSPITPKFYFEKWIGAQNEIMSQAVDYVSAKKMFPCALLLLDIEETSADNTTIEIEPFTLFLFISTNPEKDSVWRHANTFPILRSIYSNIIKELSLNANVLGDFEHTKTERFYLGTTGKNQNKLNSALDAIELKISKLKVIKNNCIT